MLNGIDVIEQYADARAEHKALWSSAACLDLSFRSRLVLVGADRVGFLHGQVSNDVKRLKPGEGCYAALLTAKGKMETDLNVFMLPDEILLDFEPGFAKRISERLEKFIIAEEVQVIDASPHYGLLSVQGPRSNELISRVELGLPAPPQPMMFSHAELPGIGLMYLMNLPRLNTSGFDLFVPLTGIAAVWDRLRAATNQTGGELCGWRAFEIARVEAGLPRFGQDMNATTLPPEAGLEPRAISYTKGCYIGQEVMSRIRTYGQVAKVLRGLRLPDELKTLPSHGEKLFKDGKEAGFITSAITSWRFEANLALGYVRRDANQTGGELTVRSGEFECGVKIVELPFEKNFT